MPQGVGVSGAFSQAISKDIDHVFFDEYPRQDSEHDKVAKFGTATAAYIKRGQASPLGGLQIIPEGTAMVWETWKQGNTKQVTFDPIGLGVQITRVLYDDDRTMITKNIPAQLAKSAAYYKEVRFWDLLNSGFVTTSRVGIDTLALFSAAHTRVDFATAGVNLTTAAALAETTLTAALDTFENLTNEKGMPIKVKPKLLIIPPALKWVAKRLLLTPYRPGSSDNDVNVLKDEGLQYMICHYLTSTTAWFLVADDHDLNFIWRKNLAVETGDDINTGNALVKITGRMTVDFWDWVGAFGNQGA